MGRRFSLRKWATLGALGLAALPGCQIPAKFPQELSRNQLDADRQGSIQSRAKVHVVFLNGFDPTDSGHFQDLHNYIREAGFPSTYYGWAWNVQTLADWMKKIPPESQAQRIVIVTHGCGAVGTKHLAKALATRQRMIDSLIMIDPPPGCENLVPDLVGDRMSIIPGKAVVKVWEMEGDLVIPDANDFDTCTHEATRDVLLNMLNAMADIIEQESPTVLPIPITGAGGMPPALDGPGSGVPGARPQPRDEWDYLKPQKEKPELPQPTPSSNPSGPPNTLPNSIPPGNRPPMPNPLRTT